MVPGVPESDFHHGHNSNSGSDSIKKWNYNTSNTRWFSTIKRSIRELELSNYLLYYYNPVTQRLGRRSVPQHAGQPGLLPGQHGDERQRAEREPPVRSQEGRLMPLHLHIPRQGMYQCIVCMLI